ncbi:MAG TPA: hypothetical protein EYP19_15695, partial [Desulfobacterales bacterium]|nr:hypothetical protein [Desulfobacterales bacterium]
MERIPPVLTSANYYANPNNKWEQHFFPRIKPWMVPWDPEGPPQQERECWRNIPMWTGFALAVFVFGMRGLHEIFPRVVPNIPVQYNMRRFFNVFPWTATGYFVVHCSLAAIGFFYLLPKQVTFSLWFFYIVSQLELVGFASAGFVDGPSIVDYQTVGAWFALVAGWLWLGKRHLRTILRSSLGGKGATSGGELLPYSVAFWGLWLSFAGCVWFGYAMGMSIPVAILMFGVYLFCQVIVMAR